MNNVGTAVSPFRRAAQAASVGFGLQEGRAREGEEVAPLTRYWRIFLRRRWIIAGIIAATALLGLVATLMMTPQFTATSLIEIAREEARILDIEGAEPKGASVDMEFYQTQFGLLESRSLAERVARDLKLAESDAFFSMFGVEFDAGLFANKAATRLTPVERAERERLAAEILLDNISLGTERASRLVYINFTSPDPELSTRVANAWAEHFIQSNLERRFQATSYARKFLEDRLEQVRGRLEESERQLVGYATNQRIINLGAGTGGNGEAQSGERSLVAEDLATLNSELADATADRVRAESRWRQVGNGNSGATPEALSNVAISSLRQKRAELAGEYARLMSQFEPDYPPAQGVTSQIAQIDRSIAREEARVRQTLQSAYRESLAREAALAGRVENLKSNLFDLRRRSIQYNIYQRDVDTNRQLYDGLLQRYKEIGVAGGVGTNNVSIVDLAESPKHPSQPRPLLNMVLAILIGTVLGLAVAFALEQIDEAITDPADLERALNVPLLGTVPKVKDESPIVLLADRKSPIAEAYLSVQTNLEFSTTHGAPKSLSVTSTRPAEGKSTTAYAIATTLARLRRRVILVDGDMRSPSVHHQLNFKNEAGLSNYLAGGDDLTALIRASGIENLDTMTAGPQPPNAAELLTGGRLDELLKLLGERYDHVIVDSPPVMGLADAPLLASHVEGTILAVESHGIRSSEVKVALARLVNANAHIIGAVLTKFEAQRSSLGYGYSYGYSYGRPGEAGA